MNSPESTMERDLRAIDDALHGAPRDDVPEVAELQELALALRAETPEPDREFAELLRERAKAGFPAARRRARMPKLLPAVGFAGMLAAVLVVAAVVLPGQNGGSGDGDEGGSVASDAGGGGGVALEKASPGSSGFAPGRSDRKIERSVDLELAAPVDRMERVADQVTAVTNRYGGFVLSSSLSTGEDDGGGEFDLRIPATRLRPALRDLSALATVTSQSQSGRDVTREHVTARDRLESARAERASLLRRLESADTDEEAEGLRQRLDRVAIEIRGLRSQLRDLRLATNYASVTVTLARAAGDSGGAGIGDAFDDAGNILVGGAGILIRVLAVALPLGLIALAGWLAGSAFRRRRRESALV